MYRCQSCCRIVPPRTPAVRVVVERRRRKYPVRVRTKVNAKGKPRRMFVDKGGTGQEIARELTVCPVCSNGRLRGEVARE